MARRPSIPGTPCIILQKCEESVGKNVDFGLNSALSRSGTLASQRCSHEHGEERNHFLLKWTIDQW